MTAIEKIEELSQEIDVIQRHVAKLKADNAPATSLIETYARLREVVEAMDEVSKALSAAHEEMRMHMIPQAFERENIQSLNTKSGHRVTVSSIVRASMGSDRKDEAMEWLKDNGLGDLIKPTVNASSLAAAAKDFLGQGKELPPDLFTVAVLPQTSFTKAKSKAK